MEGTQRPRRKDFSTWDEFNKADLAFTSSPDPNPSDVAYDDMARAWGNGDYPLAWALADVLLQYIADGGQPLTGDRDLYYTIRIHARYTPPAS